MLQSFESRKYLISNLIKSNMIILADLDQSCDTEQISEMVTVNDSSITSYFFYNTVKCMSVKYILLFDKFKNG